jgi:hypothetical protein
MNYDPITQHLLLPPKDIDLSQAHSVSAPQTSPIDLIKSVIIDCANDQMRATQTVLDEIQADTNRRFETLTANINAVLNDFAQRQQTQTEAQIYLEDVLATFIKLYLAADSMSDEVKEKHIDVITQFLLQNASTAAADQCKSQT